MKIKFVYGILPALVFYTDRLPAGFAGDGTLMVIRIRPGSASDEGLLQHELTHVRQAYRGLILIHALLYQFSDDYRLAAEVEAYRKQLEYSVDRQRSIVHFASFICDQNRYGLQVKGQDVENMLRGA